MPIYVHLGKWTPKYNIHILNTIYMCIKLNCTINQHRDFVQWADFCRALMGKVAAQGHKLLVLLTKHHRFFIANLINFEMLIKVSSVVQFQCTTSNTENTIKISLPDQFYSLTSCYIWFKTRAIITGIRTAQNWIVYEVMSYEKQMALPCIIILCLTVTQCASFR
jgi:hypothetical protein